MATKESFLKVSTLDIGVTSDLYVAGITEDGNEFIAETYRLCAEDSTGNRWFHSKRFPGCECVAHEEGYSFRDTRSNAIASAERLLEKVLAAACINLECWHEGPPAYGSDAYVAYGQADEVAWERAQG